MRIIDAIKAGKEFAVYVVMPMHPEGDPKSVAVQVTHRLQLLVTMLLFNYILQEIQYLISTNREDLIKAKNCS